MDLHENLTKDVSSDKENIVKFWKSSSSGSRCRDFLKDSSTLKYGAFFHSLGHISQKTLDHRENFVGDVSLDTEVPTEFWKSSRSEADPRWIHSPSALVDIVLHW